MYVIFGIPQKSKFQLLCDDLRADGYNIRIGQGEYKGVKEHSVMVQKDSTPESDFIQDCLMLARKFKQECILLVSDKGLGTLVYPKGDEVTHEDIGIIKPVDYIEAKMRGSYSYFGGIYFIFE